MGDGTWESEGIWEIVPGREKEHGRWYLGERRNMGDSTWEREGIWEMVPGRVKEYGR